MVKFAAIDLGREDTHASPLSITGAKVKNT
jgi:hypothetical protein